MTTPKRIAAVAVAAALVALLVWVLLPRASAPQGEIARGDGPRGTAPPPSLEGRKGTEGARGKEAKEGAEAPAPMATKARTVTGHVVGADGRPIAGCRVVVPLWGLGSVAPVDTDAEGAFSVRIPALAVEPEEVRLSFAVAGYAVAERRLQPGFEGALAVPVRLGEGPVLEGRVVDPAGRGVADFVVTIEYYIKALAAFDHGSDYFVGSVDPRDGISSGLIAFAVTDREGAFRILGVADGTAYGRGEGWMLDGPQRTHPGAQNVLKAVHAAVTGVRLAPPRGAALPESWGFRLAAEGYGGEGRTQQRSSLAVWWSRAEGRPPVLRADFSVQVEGYEPASQSVVVPAEETRRDVEFRLRPLAPADDARLVVTVVTEDAVFAKRPFDLETYDPDRRDVQVARVHAETLPDGRVLARVTPGRWWLRLRPGDGWCNPVYWEGEQLLAGGRENPVTWRVPPHGGATITAAPGAIEAGDTFLSVSPSDGGGGSNYPFFDRDRPLEIQALTVGEWKVRLGFDDRTWTFHVRPGETTQVTLTALHVEAKALR